MASLCYILIIIAVLIFVGYLIYPKKYNYENFANGQCCWWPTNVKNINDCTSLAGPGDWCSDSPNNCNECEGKWFGSDSANNGPTDRDPPIGPVIDDLGNGGCCWSGETDWDKCLKKAPSDNWCSQSRDNCEGKCNSVWIEKGNTGDSGSGGAGGGGGGDNRDNENNGNNDGDKEKNDDYKPIDSDPGIDPGGWEGTIKGTHYWDCSGQGCDSGTVDGSCWGDEADGGCSKYRSSHNYAPTDPNKHGGPMYGEKLWLTGAANNELSNILGQTDGCCGSDDKGGCGKCLLIRNKNAANPDWTAVVMKKNQVGNNNGAGPAHFDILAPGYDDLQWSLANICGKPGTGFNSREDSEVMKRAIDRKGGMPDNGYAGLIDACNDIQSPRLREGCKLFGQWGWREGDPQFDYKKVECPPKFKEIIENSFTREGPVNND